MSDEGTDERREAAGARGDGGRHLADAVRQLDLTAAARELREDETWHREGHNARTLVKNETLRIVLIDMHEGARLGEHRTDSRISIQVLTGKVSVILPAGSYEVAAGQLLAVTGCIPHDVVALEPSAFLLTLARESRREARETH